MRNEQQNYQEPWNSDADHPQLTADTTYPVLHVPAGQKWRFDSGSYWNPTGLAADATNAFALTLKVGATVIAQVFNTDADDDPAGASIPVGTRVPFVPSATPANLVVEGPADVVLAFDEDGTATLPYGRASVRGRLL